uniref:Candidate secreted effector n=1 Tax=Meloidogyne incognita TaxID=6306 RepID=A0A914LUS8_MELIC
MAPRRESRSKESISGTAAPKPRKISERIWERQNHRREGIKEEHRGRTGTEFLSGRGGAWGGSEIKGIFIQKFKNFLFQGYTRCTISDPSLIWILRRQGIGL